MHDQHLPVAASSGNAVLPARNERLGSVLVFGFFTHTATHTHMLKHTDTQAHRQTNTQTQARRHTATHRHRCWSIALMVWRETADVGVEDASKACELVCDEGFFQFVLCRCFRRPKAVTSQTMCLERGAQKRRPYKNKISGHLKFVRVQVFFFLPSTLNPLDARVSVRNPERDRSAEREVRQPSPVIALL